MSLDFTVRDVVYGKGLSAHMAAGMLLSASEMPGLSDQAFRLLARLIKEANERAKVSRVPEMISAYFDLYNELVEHDFITLEAEVGQPVVVTLRWSAKA